MLNLYPGLKSLVVTPTCNNKALDVIVTNTHRYYDPAVVFPPIHNDVPGCGVPSDHGVAVAMQPVDYSNHKSLLKTEVRVRHNLNRLGIALAQENWEAHELAPVVDSMANLIDDRLWSLIHMHCPTSRVKVRPHHLFNPTSKLAQLSEYKSKLCK